MSSNPPKTGTNTPHPEDPIRLVVLPEFAREAKRLAKKYPSLKADLARLFAELGKNPLLGTPVGSVRKVRLAIASKQRGKSGGGRVITLLVVADSTLVLLYIYDKSEVSALSEPFLKQLTELAYSHLAAIDEI